jgi:hypothetical protein
MANEGYDTRKLLVLRKLTRAVAELLRGQLQDYLTTLTPLLRPKTVLGEYVGPPTKDKDNVAGADKAFKELQAQYDGLAAAKSYGLPRGLNPPLASLSTTLELTPLEYAHPVSTGAETKTVTVSTPLQWVVSYGGFTPKRLRETLAARDRMSADLQQVVLHALMLHAVVTRQSGVTRLLEALHFPMQTVRRPEFGDLPLVCVVAAVSTTRPPDEVLLESTELSGMNVFEEVVNAEDVLTLRDPLRERLLELVKSHGLSPSPRV